MPLITIFDNPKSLRKESAMNIHTRFIKILVIILSLCLLSVQPAVSHEKNLHRLDTNPHVRTPITHGFWFPKLVTLGEEWYRGRLIQQDGHGETGELPDKNDTDGHLGFTAVNATRWLITHHWFNGDDVLADDQLYSRNPNWFFNAADPADSVMGVFALFRWGIIDEMTARLMIHRMINRYTDQTYSILGNGAWLQAMADLSQTDFTDNNGIRDVPNPLDLPPAEAIRNEVAVIITHHFFGRNRNNTDRVMTRIYPDLVEILMKFNSHKISEREARLKIAVLATRMGRGKRHGDVDNR